MKTRTGFAGRLLCVLLCLMFVFGSAVPAAAEGEISTRTVTLEFSAFKRLISWEYEYSEDIFRMPADEYNHDLARLSLGMALAAFRREEEDHQDTQDDCLIDFFETLGFTDIETEPYRTKPTTDSIGYGIAELRQDGMTVIALAVCGGGYGAEWASNLTVGTNERPDGFQDAATKVQKALADYIERHAPEGDLVLWTSGFSRAGAVSNLTAADCTASGQFRDVYAYTFATPRTIMNPAQYNNIYNIMQKNDIVPKIPLGDWGFERYGKDMYLVSPEIDLDCEAVVEKTNELYRKMLGSAMVWNFEMNYQLRTLLDYLYLIVSTPAAYTTYLQPLILDIMTQSDETKDALFILLEALQRYSLETEQQGEELKAMMDYLESVISVYYLQKGIDKLPADQWDPDWGTINLFNEHMPFEYLALMFASDDPNDVFSNKTEYVRVVIYGDVEAEILEGEKVLKTIQRNGTQLVNGVEVKNTSSSVPHVDVSDKKLVITLPSDRSFTVRVRSKALLPQTITYTGLLFSGNTVRAKSDDQYSFVMSRGDEATIKTSAGGRAIEPDSSSYTDVTQVIDMIYSPTTAMRLENNSVVHLTIAGFLNKLLFVLALLLLQGLVSLVLTIIRKKKHRQRNDVVALVWHLVIALVFAILEMAMWYFIPILTIARFICEILVVLVFIAYALKGYKTYRKNLKWFFILTGAFLLYGILASLLFGEFRTIKGLITLIIYIGFFIAAYILLWNKQKDKKPAAPKTAAPAGAAA